MIKNDFFTKVINTNYTTEIKKIFNKTVSDANETIPLVFLGLAKQWLDLKDHIDNELDFGPNVLIASILERHIVYGPNKDLENDNNKSGIMISFYHIKKNFYLSNLN